MKNTIIHFFRSIAFISLLLIPVAYAQSTTAESTPSITETPAEPSERAQTVRKLLTIKLALDSRREQIRTLVDQLQTADEARKIEINEQVNELRQTIEGLTRSFEYFAVSGISPGGLDEEKTEELDWRDELVQIARPLIEGLKEATEKPRQIEELRRSIEQYEKQLVLVNKGRKSIEILISEQMDPVVASGLTELKNAWASRSSDIDRSLEIARGKLEILQVENTRFFETTGQVLLDFLQGRGLTLLLAVLFAVGIWLVMSNLHRLVKQWRKPSQDKAHKARVRLLLYVYHLLTIVLMSLSVLTVFYLRGDLLLLSLGIFALAMLVLSAWRFMPSYILEARLLLNMGTARESERVIYNGLPFRITSLNLYSELRNPELEGGFRLPLNALAGMVSRPQSEEAWFPTKTGDYLLLADGSYAQVLQQTVEMVRLKVAGRIVQYPTADFLNMSVQNLSQEGFGVIVVFGIDYQHQAIALDQVPERFASAINQAFADSEYADDLKGLVVDFKAAATNSLDYIIFATMDGRVANAYFNIGRLIQKTCVAVCNEEDWVIPFSQLTIHQAENPPSE